MWLDEWPEYYKGHKAHLAVFGKKSRPDVVRDIVLGILEEMDGVIEMASFELVEAGLDILLELIKRKLFFFIYTS